MMTFLGKIKLEKFGMQGINNGNVVAVPSVKKTAIKMFLWIF